MKAEYSCLFILIEYIKKSPHMSVDLILLKFNIHFFTSIN